MTNTGWRVFASRWMNASLMICFYGLVAPLLAVAATFTIVAGTRLLLGWTDTGLVRSTIVQNIALFILGLLLSLFSFLVFTFLYSEIRHTIPSIRVLQRLSTFLNDDRLGEYGKHLGYAIQHCGRPLTVSSTRCLITSLVTQYSRLRPEILSPSVVEESLRLFDEKVAQTVALEGDIKTKKKELRRKNSLAKFVAGASGNQVWFASLDRSENVELEPLEKQLEGHKKSLGELEAEYVTIVSKCINIIDTPRTSTQRFEQTQGGGK